MLEPKWNEIINRESVLKDELKIVRKKKLIFEALLELKKDQMIDDDLIISVIESIG